MTQDLEEQGSHTQDRHQASRLARYMEDGKLDDAELEELAGELAAYDSLPTSERDERRKLFLSRLYQTSVEIEATSGPLPPSGMLERYEQVLPGAADRIMAMAESQLAHRHGLEDAAMRASVTGERLGTWFGGVITLVTVVGSFCLLWIGKSLEGFGAILTSLVMLVGLFTRQNASAKKELDEKRAQADEREANRDGETIQAK